MSDWLRQLRELREAKRDCVRVTVMEVRGSAPREVGATMLVTGDVLLGSIGGGSLEYESARMAAGNFRDRTSETSIKTIYCAGPTRTSVHRFALGAALGQCCGGVVDLLFEQLPAAEADWFAAAWHCYSARVPAVLATTVGADGTVSRSILATADVEQAEAEVAEAARRMLERATGARCVTHGDRRTLLEPLVDRAFEVALFGAGHVGSAVVGVLANLDCRLRWIDARRDIFPTAVPANVTAVESADPAREVAALPGGSYYLVMTHSHALDYAICERILARDDFAYCGLIGSRSKRRRFAKRLRGQGLPAARIEKLTCPIGIAGLDGKTPGEIAVAVAAELLQRRQVQRAHTVASGNVHVLRRPGSQ